jgi:hypothetical protein
MELSGLASLEKVAGLGGIAIAAATQLVLAVIAQSGKLPPAQLAPMLRLIAGGAFGIGALGIVAWIASPSPSVTVHSEPCSLAANGGASGNSIACGAPPTLTQKP